MQKIELRSEHYWWAVIYKNFKKTLNYVTLTSQEYHKEIMNFLETFEVRFLYRRILNDEELQELHRYTDNVVVKYSDPMERVNKDVG